MAKYADYVKNDNLDQEVEQVEQKKRDISDSVLRRFDGKGIEDVLESYTNLERHAGQLGDRVGRLQSTVEDLVALNAKRDVTTAIAENVKPTKAITSDDLFNDPETAVSQVVEKKVNKRLEELENHLLIAERNSKVQRLTTKYPSWQNDVRDPEFLAWVKESTYRQRLANAADQFDFDAADDLLAMWTDRNASTKQVQDQVRRERQFQDGSLESNASRTTATVKKFDRHELQETRIRAKQGDRQAQRYLQDHGDEIALAYEEGRVI